MIAEALNIASAWTGVLVRDGLLVVVVFVVVATVARCGRRIGPAFHVALWSLVFVRLLLPPGLSLPFSAGQLLRHVSEEKLETLLGHEEELLGESLLPSVATRSSTAPESPHSPLTQAFFAVWLVGSLATLGVFRRRRAVYMKVLREAHPVQKPEISAVTERWRRRLGVRRGVRVVSSDASISPFTTGVMRPVVFVPRSLLADGRSLEPVIAHEMAHVARFDALWLGLQNFVQCMYFFHPLVWISGSRLIDERERLADLTVVSTGNLAARDYVGGLLNVLRLDLQGAGAPTMSARKRRIGVRIRHILEREGGRAPRFAAALTAAAALGLFILPLSSNASADLSDESRPGKPVSSQVRAENTPNFVNPLPQGRVTSSWGPGKRNPFTKEDGYFHKGIDVAAETGTAVVAPAAGIVTVATTSMHESPASGTVVVLDHGDGLTTRYTHLESFKVRVGQQVEQRDVIATVGSTGKSTGPHLHFEVRRDDESLNPADFVADWK